MNAPADAAPVLYLVPAPLSQILPAVDLSPADLAIVRSLQHWLVETPKAARAWLKLYEHPAPLSTLNLVAISELTAMGGAAPDGSGLTHWLRSVGGPVGVMSDAGCPGVADPGAEVVAAAHGLGWRIMPMVGPSSVLLALMGSGLSGQCFAFRGYPPTDEGRRSAWIANTQRVSAAEQQTQIAIETPYRNNVLMKALCETLAPDTRLCVASELRGPGQQIQTRTVAQWRQDVPVLQKQATLFLWQASARHEPRAALSVSATGKSSHPSTTAPNLRRSSRRRV